MWPYRQRKAVGFSQAQRPVIPQGPSLAPVRVRGHMHGPAHIPPLPSQYTYRAPHPCPRSSQTAPLSHGCPGSSMQTHSCSLPSRGQQGGCQPPTPSRAQPPRALACACGRLPSLPCPSLQRPLHARTRVKYRLVCTLPWVRGRDPHPFLPTLVLGFQPLQRKLPSSPCKPPPK